jgi:propanol-preferring alcohol dehydrogenase
VHAFTRSGDAAAQEFARKLGTVWAGGSQEAPPEPLDAAILFAPVGTLVPTALAALDRGATLAVAGIYLSDIPALRYEDHLFNERILTSVTANTRADGAEFLELADRLKLRVVTTPRSFEDAPAALVDLAEGRVEGAAVIRVQPATG